MKPSLSGVKDPARKLFLGVIPALAAACSSPERLQAEWYGRHISEVERRYGPPTRVVENRYVFSRLEERSTEPYYTTDAESTPGGSFDPVERTVVRVFWVDEEGYVYRADEESP